MADKEKANQAKTKGNAAFAKGDFTQAIADFTEAIKFDPTDHVFYSNRSGAYASVGKHEEALADAKACIERKPDWAKGYSRKGLAEFNLGMYEDAQKSYEAGLKIEPSNPQLKEGLEQVTQRLESQANPMGQLFGPAMWPKLMANPVTKKYLDDPQFVEKMRMLQSNPNSFSTISQGDPKVQQALGVILGIGAQFGSEGDAGFGAGEDESDPKMDTSSDRPAQEKPKEAEKPKEPEKELTEEEKQAAERRKQAEVVKEQGNAAYKAKKFDEALALYNKAKEIDPTNFSYYNNTAIVYFAQGLWEKSIEATREAIQIGMEHHYDFKAVAKAFFRIGSAYVKLKRYDEAIEALNKSLLENHSDEARKMLKSCEEIRKKMLADAYLDKGKAAEHKEKGNHLFKENKFKEAIEEYTESIKRDPTNPASFSNRAACYTKMMDWQRGLEDCDTCLKLDPSFVKAYIRKSKIQHFLKQYHKAIETCNKGLELDPSNQELREAKILTMRAIQSESSAGVDPQRAKEALKDPEIQAILRDPIIGKVLKDLQSDPSAAQAALADTAIRAKIEKLIQAGIVGER